MTATPDRLISKKLQEVAKRLDRELEEIAGERMAFSLLIFQAVDNSRMNYISNANREEVLNALESLTKSWREGMPDIPAHEYD